MNAALNFEVLKGKTLFMCEGKPRGLLVTRSGHRMRKRAVKFADEHAALNWCLAGRVTFVLMPGITKNQLN